MVQEAEAVRWVPTMFTCTIACYPLGGERRWTAGAPTIKQYLTTLAWFLVLASGSAAAEPPRGFAGVNAGLQLGSKGFSHSVAFDHALFGPEQGQLQARYPGGGGGLFDFTVVAPLVGQLGMGAGASIFSRMETVDFTARLPHPLHFNRFRQLEGRRGDIRRKETAVHLHARWTVPAREAVEVALFGGPTFFQVSQEFLTGVAFTQEYPYDTATLERSTAEKHDGSAIGFHVGVDMSVYFSRFVGVGGLIRFSRARVDLADRGNPVTAGGVHAAAGLRLRF